MSERAEEYRSKEPIRSWNAAVKICCYAAILTIACFVAVIWPGSGTGAARAGEVFVIGGVLPIISLAFAKALRWIDRQDFFSPLFAFPIAYVVWFLVGSVDFVELPSSVSFGAFDPIPLRVLGYAAIGLLAYLSGAWICRPRMRWHSEVMHPTMNWSERRLRILLACLWAVAIGCYTLLVAKLGIPILSANAAEQRLEISNYHFASSPFFAAADTICLLAVIRWWTAPCELQNRIGRKAIATLFTIFVMLASLGGRSYFVPLLVTLVIVYHSIRRRLRFKMVVFIGIVVFAFISAYGHFRDSSEGNGFGDLLATAGIPSAIQPFTYSYLYVRYTVATFRDVTDLIPTRLPYQHGAMTLKPFSTLLPGHHEMADMVYKDLLGNDFLGAGQPATLLAPFYTDFGILGIIAGMFAFGVLLATLHRRMLRDPTPIAVMLFAWTSMAGLFGLFASLFPYIDTLALPLFWVSAHALMVQTNRHSSLPGMAAGAATV